MSLPVTGMTCAACARTIENTLKDTTGVANASVNFATGRAVVTFDPAAVGLDDLVHAVRDVGYDVIEMPKAAPGLTRFHPACRLRPVAFCCGSTARPG